MDSSFFATFKQFRETCFPQKFSLPMPLMKYIWSNPSSPKEYKKLRECCKLFFIKKSLLVIQKLERPFNFDGWKYCLSEECIYPFEAIHKKIDIDKFKDIIWLTQELFINYSHTPLKVSDLIPKIYRYDVKKLTIYEHNLTFDDLKFFSSGVEECNIGCYPIKYENGEQVPLENIVQLFSKCKKFKMNFFLFLNVKANARCEKYDDFINVCSVIQEVVLGNLPNDFDVFEFYQHLKKSKNRSLINIINPNNRVRLNEVFDEILRAYAFKISFEFVPPVITLFINTNMEEKMQEIQKNVAAKYH